VGESHGLISVMTPTIERDPLFCGYTVGAFRIPRCSSEWSPAVVEELECLTRGDPRCLLR